LKKEKEKKRNRYTQAGTMNNKDGILIFSLLQQLMLKNNTGSINPILSY